MYNKEYRRKQYLKHKKNENESSLRYYYKHKIKILKYLKKYTQTHKEEKREYWKKYKRNRRKTDINYRLRGLLSSRIRVALSINAKKTRKTHQLLGCTIPEVKQHLQKQFKKDMSWKNHAKVWEIDHIMPCASFDLKNIKEQKKCFHYTNLQPLYTNENRKKWAHIKL